MGKKLSLAALNPREPNIYCNCLNCTLDRIKHFVGIHNNTDYLITHRVLLYHVPLGSTPRHFIPSKRRTLVLSYFGKTVNDRLPGCFRRRLREPKKK